MVTIKINTREFNAEMNRIAKRSKRSLPYIANKQARKLGFECFKETVKADKAEIHRELTVQMANPISKTKSLNTIGAWAANMRRVRKGLPRVWGDALKEKTKALMNARKAAVNYVRSGWLPAIQVFSRALGMVPKSKEKKNPTPGGAIAATEGRPTAILWNSATGIEKVGKPGLEKAMRTVIADMRRYLAKDIQKGVIDGKPISKQ